MPNAQTWLDQNYPKNGVCRRGSKDINKGKTRREITALFFENQNLTGSLDLSDFVNLEILFICENNFTNLD